MHGFCLFCLLGQLGGIAVTAHTEDSGTAGAADNRTAGQQGIACLFVDCIRFAGEQGLVDLDAAVCDNGIGADLVAAFQEQNILFLHFCNGNRVQFAVSFNLGVRLGQKRQLFDQPLGFQFLCNTDDGVQCDHRNKK